MTRVNCLFFDYDGTISPLNVSRQQSKVLPHLEVLLSKINKFIPIGIITTKDLSFILPRTLFAHAWCAIAGLEMKIGSQLFVSEGVEEAMPNLEKALQFAKQNLREGGTIEEKRNYAGRPLAFCIDWRQMRDEKSARMMSAQIRSYCKGLPLEVIEYQGKPFFDVFPCSVNKGVALKSLKEKLGISRGVLYMGDSFTDNPAFEVSDISVGVTGGKSPPNLESTYWIKFEDIPFFISQLFKNQFIFNPELPGIRIRG